MKNTMTTNEQATTARYAVDRWEGDQSWTEWEGDDLEEARREFETLRDSVKDDYMHPACHGFQKVYSNGDSDIEVELVDLSNEEDIQVIDHWDTRDIHEIGGLYYDETGRDYEGRDIDGYDEDGLDRYGQSRFEKQIEEKKEAAGLIPNDAIDQLEAEVGIGVNIFRDGCFMTDEEKRDAAFRGWECFGDSLGDATGWTWLHPDTFDLLDDADYRDWLDSIKAMIDDERNCGHYCYLGELEDPQD